MVEYKISLKITCIITEKEENIQNDSWKSKLCKSDSEKRFTVLVFLASNLKEEKFYWIKIEIQRVVKESSKCLFCLLLKVYSVFFLLFFFMRLYKTNKQALCLDVKLL
jgi:hypothetical protein